VDGTCRLPREQENLCPSSRYTGYDAHGDTPTNAVVPQDFAYELPGDFDDEHVAPLLCGGLIGYRALDQSRLAGRTADCFWSDSVVRRISLFSRTSSRPQVYVLTRSENHITVRRTWRAGPVQVSAIYLRKSIRRSLCPSGRLVRQRSKLRSRRDLCHRRNSLSDVPALIMTSSLQERQLRRSCHTRAGCSALWRGDSDKLKPTSIYDLPDANRALRDMKQSAVDGTPVLMWPET